MPLIFFQANRLGPTKLYDFAVNSHAHKPFPFRFFDHVAKFARLILHERREDDDFRLRVIPQDLIDNLLRRLSINRSSGHWIMRPADGRKKHAQVIIDFGRGCDCRSWICTCAALFDGDGGGKSFDEIDVRFFHLIEKLPGVSREAFDITPLAFGIERVEGER